MFIINDSFVKFALRQNGYDEASAIGEFVDNSIEQYVNASFVQIRLICQNKALDSILVIDDGCGMSMATLEEAMKFGADTGKTLFANFGAYGAGFKTAGISLGQTIEVFTKDKESDVLNYSKFSLKDSIEKNGEIIQEFKELPFDSQEYKWFSKEVKNSEHGSIFRISDLDKITYSEVEKLRKYLIEKLGIMFYREIDTKSVKMFLDDYEISAIDPTESVYGSEYLGKENIVCEGHEFVIKYYYKPMCGAEDENSNSSIETSKDGKKTLRRVPRYRGFYAVRHGRVTGFALQLGIVNHPQLNGLIGLIEYNGDGDEILGSTFTKIVRDESGFNKSFYEELVNKSGKYTAETRRRQIAESKSKNTDNDPETEKRKDEFYSKVKKKQNDNPLLKLNELGEEKEPAEKKEHKKRGPQKNPNPHKVRDNGWLKGFSEQHLGRDYGRFIAELTGGKANIIVNMDHPWYDKVYSHLDEETKFFSALSLSCDVLAKTSCNYFSDPNVQRIIDCYSEFLDTEIVKSLKY